eukprot:TRINITY_DN33661_c0_g1_i2.p1 TRINITY_DN33661_c0_g1~~TRINITY_DN33661_c0_g1_i2.p1  ORF type:complete len:490 (-),score=97.90 TRINITY_DN33661_c0_g1_i2:148-1617(-)
MQARLYEGVSAGMRRFLSQKVFSFGGKVALTNALLAAMLKALYTYGPEDVEAFQVFCTASTTTTQSLSFLIGLFVAFRASQAYSRFWAGVTSSVHIIATLTETSCSLFGFMTGSKASAEKLDAFRQQIVRYFSIMHSMMLAELENIGEITGDESSFEYPLLDPNALDPELFERLQASNAKVHLVFSWIQRLIMEAINDGVVCAPPPICTRAFNELNKTMGEYHDALRLAEVPFPYPYTMATTMCLVIHWIVNCLVQPALNETITSTFMMSFVQVFMLWSLNEIAAELENPFGSDINDVDGKALHDYLNEHLVALLEDATKRRPGLRRDFYSCGQGADSVSSTGSFRNYASYNSVVSSLSSKSGGFGIEHEASDEKLQEQAQVSHTTSSKRRPSIAPFRTNQKKELVEEASSEAPGDGMEEEHRRSCSKSTTAFSRGPPKPLDEVQQSTGAEIFTQARRLTYNQQTGASGTAQQARASGEASEEADGIHV